MLRFCLFLAACLSTLPAYATPKVGDYAAYNTTVVEDNQSATADMSLELISYDKGKNEYLERQTIQFPGQQPTVTDTARGPNDLLTDAQIDDLLAHCGERGGTPQKLVVPAGIFSTCAMPFTGEQSVGINWVARVPFGFARLVSVRKNTGVTVTSELRNYR